MSLIKKRYIVKSPKLHGNLVENILFFLIENELSIDRLYLEIHQRMPLSFKQLKKYLVYLIDYEILSYNGQKSVLLIEEGGFDLLDSIILEKNKSNTNSDDLTITIEREFYEFN